jgi:hypothetical protein
MGTLPKNQLSANADLLRIHAFWRFYRYKTNITAFIEFQKYRLVGDITGFRTAKKLVSRNPQFFMKYSGVRNAHSRLLVFVFFN